MSDPTPPYPGGQQYPAPAGGPHLPAGGPPPGYPQGGSSPLGYGNDSGKGFFGALFDFSFSSFVTPKIVKLVYILATVAVVIGVLIIVIAGFAQSAGSGLAALVLAPIIGLIYLAFIRMTLEFYFALVRMSEDIHHRLPRT